MLIIKNHSVYSEAPFPTWIVVSWIIIFIIVFIGLIWVWIKNRNNPKEEEWNPYDPPIDISVHGKRD